MGESRWAAGNGRSIGCVICYGLSGKAIKDRDVDRDFVEEDTEAPANGCAVVARGREDEADARSNVDAFGGEADVFKAQANIQGQAGMELPVVLRKEGEIIG
jgi:hypothetical protein